MIDLPQVPGWDYVSQRRDTLKQYWQGFHKKFDEVERLRYYEDQINISPEEKATGLEVRVGMTADLIEQAKSAMTTNTPQVQFIPHRENQKAKGNSDKREKFWQEYLNSLNTPIPTLNELVDAQAMGQGILKASFNPWPREPREKLDGESADDYLTRQVSLKKLWGPPFAVVTIHPLTFLPEYGYQNRLVEAIESSLKSRTFLSRDLAEISQAQAQELSGQMGHPLADIKDLPASLDSTGLVEVTEYWRYNHKTGWPDIYQMYVGSNKVYEERGAEVGVVYLPLLGRTTSSTDPDKLSISIAEYLRHNEPVINRSITRMAEATELLVHKRLAMQLAEGSTDEFSGELDASNNPIRTTIPFRPGEAVATPPGGTLVDAFAGVEHAYSSMPFVQLLMQLAGQRGVAPIFKGQSPGADGSGYRDNSLYMMALSQFKYMIEAYQMVLANLIRWFEYILVNQIKQEIFVGDLSLAPKDIVEFPATIKVKVEAFLPQNIIQDGQFYMLAHKGGFVTKRMVLEEGFHKGQPEEIETEQAKEEIKGMLKPILYQDVLDQVLYGGQKQPPSSQPPQPQGLVDQYGNPLPASGGSSNGVQSAPTGGGPDANQAMGQLGQMMSGMARAGTGRQPPMNPGETEHVPGIGNELRRG